MCVIGVIELRLANCKHAAQVYHFTGRHPRSSHGNHHFCREPSVTAQNGARMGSATVSHFRADPFSEIYFESLPGGLEYACILWPLHFHPPQLLSPTLDKDCITVWYFLLHDACAYSRCCRGRESKLGFANLRNNS